MLPSFSESNFDKIAAIGSYYIAAAALIMALATLVVTAAAIYFSVKHSRELKSVEVDQKKFENALDLVRIVAGVRDNFPDGSHATFFQIAAVESLALYPNYIELYRYMRDWYSQEGRNEHIYAATVRLVQKVERGDNLA